MDIELIETLKFIIERHDNRTTGSVFILMSDFPWYNERNGQLTKLQEAGLITEPRYSGNGAEITLTNKGQKFFEDKHWILFPQQNEPLTCPVCGYQAKVLNTDAARSWVEVSCENCGTYALRPDALEDIPSIDLPLLSGYYRHVHRQPMTVQCDSKETVIKHIEETRQIVTRDYQMKMLLSYYYQKMSRFGDYVEINNLPAIAYARSENDLNSLMAEAIEQNYAVLNENFVSVTMAGKEFIDKHQGETKMARPTVFISYNWGNSDIADDLEASLAPYAEVKRDKKSVGAWSDLVEFMKSIRQQDFAVLIISDAYLKSDACLFEVMELMKDEHWDDRVMYVVTEDAHGVYDTKKQLTYIGYWKDKETELAEEIKKYDPAAVTSQAEELKKFTQIALNIGAFMSKVKQVNSHKQKHLTAARLAVGRRIMSGNDDTLFLGTGSAVTTRSDWN